MKHPYRPAHWRVYLDGFVKRVCVEHAETEPGVKEPIPPAERDSPGCWCDVCSPQGDITHHKETDQ